MWYVITAVVCIAIGLFAGRYPDKLSEAATALVGLFRKKSP